MEIHKPKPVRSWRELFTEIGIIVLSVCVALAAEQAVEWVHWRQRVADARAAMVLELRDDDAPQAFTRVAAAACFEEQLNTLQDAIEAAQPRAEIAARLDRYKLPFRTWPTTSWNAMQASDVTSHVSPEQLIQWSSQYVRVSSLADLGTAEGKDFVALRLVRRSGEKLLPGEADAMLAAISRLRWENRAMQGLGLGLLANLKKSGIEVVPLEQHRILTSLKALYHDCVITPSVPLGAPSDTDQTLMLRQPPPAR